MKSYNQRVLQYLKTNKPVVRRVIVDALGIPPNAVSVSLHQLRAAGEVARSLDGVWFIPGRHKAPENLGRAQHNGLSYVSDRVCCHGHIPAYRYISSGGCIACRAMRTKGKMPCARVTAGDVLMDTLIEAGRPMSLPQLYEALGRLKPCTIERAAYRGVKEGAIYRVGRGVYSIDPLEEDAAPPVEVVERKPFINHRPELGLWAALAR